MGLNKQKKCNVNDRPLGEPRDDHSVKHKKLMEAGNLILDLWNCISLISAVFGC